MSAKSSNFAAQLQTNEMKKLLFVLISLAGLAVVRITAQPRFSQPHGLYVGGTLTVAITPTDSLAEVRYTTDGSEPTATSQLYTSPLRMRATTLLRAVEVKGDSVTSAVSTASYLFISSVLNQKNNPTGYPTTWGAYTQIRGTATADYEMDAEMTGDTQLRPKIIEGLQSLQQEEVTHHETYPSRRAAFHAACGALRGLLAELPAQKGEQKC